MQSKIFELEHTAIAKFIFLESFCIILDLPVRSHVVM